MIIMNMKDSILCKWSVISRFLHEKPLAIYTLVSWWRKSVCSLMYKKKFSQTYHSNIIIISSVWCYMYIEITQLIIVFLFKFLTVHTCLIDLKELSRVHKKKQMCYERTLSCYDDVLLCNLVSVYIKYLILIVCYCNEYCLDCNLQENLVNMLGISIKVLIRQQY